MRLPGYRGNTNLKRPNLQIEWTPEMIQEWIKCSEDPIYFIETYLSIVDADGELVPFKLRDYQKEIILSYKNNRRTIVGTARQAGKSTTTAAFITWFILFNERKNVAILANKDLTAMEILSRVQAIYETVPPWLQQGVTEWNKTEFVLENKSRVFSRATSKDSIRGYTIHFLMIDEAAHIDNWTEFYTSSSQTMSSGKKTKIAMVSTPNGLNHFHEFWDGAIKQKNGFHPIKVTWNMIEGRDEEWKQNVLQELNFDEQKFAQEHEMEFIGSSGTLIAGWKLAQLEAMDPIYLDPAGLKKYYEPVKPRVENDVQLPGHVYAMVCDVSRGKGFDYSAFSVIDVTSIPFQQVCTFRSNRITPTDYAEFIYHVAKVYNEAYILVELNDIGGQVADLLWNEYEYMNIIRTESAGRAGKRITFDYNYRTDNGVKTSAPIRNNGCWLVKLLIEQNKLILNDYDTIQEFNTFSKKNNKYQAEEGKNDDMVMTLVLFAWMSDQQAFSQINNINTMLELRDRSDEEMMNSVVPFGFIQDGNNYEQDRNDLVHFPDVVWDEYNS